MSIVAFRGQEELVSGLDSVVRGAPSDELVPQVTDVLTGMIKAGQIELTELFRTSHPDHYARRLLHKSDELGYCAVVMVWGVGQGTLLHDHSGCWGVVGVVEGVLDVVNYDLLERKDDLYRFEPKPKISAGVGAAGIVVPPYEYHTIHNAVSDQPSISLHVYEAELTECGIYTERDDGSCDRTVKQLGYD